ncbi:hypothetical protein JOB18_011277 [Solea senegalensis]|uniref:Uncharacterized protein n=1 Tax=Solea senegalensis TaxID=28829 RepID=A0AAV6RTZ7_SOLSE|nr:hypothetical protein JOB18_011277 [Solea senegalensis]
MGNIEQLSNLDNILWQKEKRELQRWDGVAICGRGDTTGLSEGKAEEDVTAR